MSSDGRPLSEITAEDIDTVKTRLGQIAQILSDGIYREKLTIPPGIWIGEPIVILANEAAALLCGRPGKEKE